jgi:hypothetical protein
LPDSIEVLNILLFLIPGFISSVVLNTVTVRKGERKELQRIVEALIFSMLVYAIYSLFGRSPILPDSQNVAAYDPLSLLILSSLALALPLVIGLFVTNDWHMWVARKLRITNKTSRSSLWYDVFAEQQRYVIVYFKDGSRVCGWPRHYSDDPDAPYIFLTDPLMFKDGEFVEAEGVNGVLITPALEVTHIEYLNS